MGAEFPETTLVALVRTRVEAAVAADRTDQADIHGPATAAFAEDTPIRVLGTVT